MATAKVVLITGANTGIGYETVKALLRSDTPYYIFLGGRDFEKAQQAAKIALREEKDSRSSVEPVQIDVQSDDSITKAFEALSSKVDRLDCLVNNAGASFDMDLHSGRIGTREAWNKTWDVNVTGAQITTLTFLPLLFKSHDPRLIFVTSGASSLTMASDVTNPWHKSPPAGMPKPLAATSYRSSKAGMNMLMVEWARMLRNDGVKVWAIAPGLLATNLGGDPDFLKKLGAKDPKLGGEALRGLIEGKRDADVGKVVREYETPIQPW